MNLRDWYFRQIVSQGDMDEAFDWAQDADHDIVADSDLDGIVSGGNVSQNTTPDLNVLVDGPLIGYDGDGQRLYIADASQLVDCSQDEYAVSTEVTTVGQERWISVFVRFTRRLEDPEIDGNSNEVYTRQYEDAEIFVRQGAPAAIGAATKPALLDDAKLLVDINRQFGQTTFTTGDLDDDRRQDWLHYESPNFGVIGVGSAREAMVQALTLVDTLWNAFPFSFTADWFGSNPVSGSAPPVTTMQEAFDAIVYDLAQTETEGGGNLAGTDLIGVRALASLTYVSWGLTDLNSALVAIATAIDGHIGGAAPKHPADAIDPGVFTVPGATWADQTLPESQFYFSGIPAFGTIFGGTLPPQADPRAVAGQFWAAAAPYPVAGWGHPFAAYNQFQVAGAPSIVDVCHGIPAIGGDPTLRRARHYALDATNVALVVMNGGNATVYGSISLAGALPPGNWTPTAMCGDELNLYIMLQDDGGGVPANTSHRVIAIEVPETHLSPLTVKTGWPATGVALPNTGVSPYATTLADRIRLVGPDRIATCNSWVPAVANTSPCLSVIDATNGTILSSGAGDAPNAAANYPCGGIAANGTNIVFSLELAGSQSAVASAQVANAQNGSGMALFPVNPPYTSPIQEVLYDGQVWMWVEASGGNPVVIYSNGAVRGLNDVGALYGDTRFAALDGFNLWLQERDAANELALRGISLGEFGTANRDLGNMIVRRHGFMNKNEENTVPAANMGRMHYDGDAVWMIMDHRAGQTLSGFIRRMPRAGVRA